MLHDHQNSNLGRGRRGQLACQSPARRMKSATDAPIILPRKLLRSRAARQPREKVVMMSKHPAPFGYAKQVTSLDHVHVIVVLFAYVGPSVNAATGGSRNTRR